MTAEMKESIEKRHKHARNCKKDPMVCAACQGNIAYFKRMSLTDLSEALADKPTRRTA